MSAGVRLGRRRIAPARLARAWLRLLPRLCLLPLLGLLLLATGVPARAQLQGTPGQFDYYVLALSWSPSYCAGAGDRADPQQCRRGGRPLGFVVHGLWPQYEEGWPQDCQKPAPRIPEPTVRAMQGIMPSRGLVIYQWRKHGTCSGLEPDAYFDAVRRAFSKVNIPGQYRRPDRPVSTSAPEVENAFRVANPSLASDMIAVQCEDGRVSEVRICLDAQLAFTRCAAVDRRSCRGGRLTLPPTR